MRCIATYTKGYLSANGIPSCRLLNYSQETATQDHKTGKRDSGGSVDKTILKNDYFAVAIQLFIAVVIRFLVPVQCGCMAQVREVICDRQSVTFTDSYRGDTMLITSDYLSRREIHFNVHLVLFSAFL